MNNNPTHIVARLIVILSLIIASSIVFAQNSDYNYLKDGFANPPQEAKPLVWWDWVNGNITKEGIKADLVSMKQIGIGGAQLFDLLLYMPEGPVRYGSESWYEHVNYAVHIADSLGLEFHVMNCPGWSASGGPWNTPETSAKKIVWSETSVKGAKKQVITLSLPEIKLGYYEEVAIFAVPAKYTARTLEWEKKIACSKTSLKRDISTESDSTIIPLDKIINLTGKLTGNGIVNCELPAGEWSILRFGYTTTAKHNHPAQPEGHGLECDKMNAESVQNQFEYAIGRIIEDARPYLGKTFKGILFDSYEGGYSNWTKNFPTEFKRIHGYDIVSYLPVLAGRVIQSKAFTEAILHDFRYAVEKLHADVYLKTAQEFAHNNGLITYAESQGGPLNPFWCNQYIDVPMNEFWLRNYTKRANNMKFSAASANLYNKRLVAAESFTAIPDYAKWRNTPYTLKRAGDAAFTSGINRFIFHTFVHQSYEFLKPGFTMGRYGTHFGRQCTWWPYAGAWIDYISRSSFLLQQGKRETDIGMLLGNDKGYGYCSSLGASVPDGYDYTICYPEHLANAKVVNGKIQFSRLSECNVLVLDNDDRFMSLTAIRHLYRLLNDGAVIAGNAPVLPAGLIDLTDSLGQYENLIDKIWGDLEANEVRNIGKGKILNSTNQEWIIKQLGMTPDLEFAPNVSKDSLRYIHKRINDTDLYFISNLTSQKQAVSVKARIMSKKPELWDAVLGTIRELPEYNIVDGRTEIPLTLEAAESVFLIFDKALPSRWTTRVYPNVLKCVNGKYYIQGKKTITLSYSDGSIDKIRTKKCGSSIDLSENWSVKFLDGRGAPDGPIIFKSLKSWHEHQNNGIKYYSGSVEYTKTFLLPENYLKKGQRCLLSLGDLNGDVAQICINDSEPLSAWYYPAEFDICDHLVKGENSLKIIVINRWVNRLIGDEKEETNIPYRQGNSRFTRGVIDEFPDWMRDKQRASSENLRHTFTTWKHFSDKSPLQKSGLLGPIKIEVYNEFNN